MINDHLANGTIVRVYCRKFAENVDGPGAAYDLSVIPYYSDYHVEEYYRLVEVSPLWTVRNAYMESNGLDQYDILTPLEISMVFMERVFMIAFLCARNGEDGRYGIVVNNRYIQAKWI